MFHSCLSDWTFTSKWTMRSLLAHYDDNVTWITDVSVDHKSPIPMKMIDRPEMEKAEGPVVRIYCDVCIYFYIFGMIFQGYLEHDMLLPGSKILDLMDRNVTIRVFERMGVAPRRPPAEYVSTHKPDLFADWEWPKPIPKDLYKEAFGGSDFQWIIMSQPQTGTHIHHDPEVTDAWNALFYGHKVQPLIICL